MSVKKPFSRLPTLVTPVNYEIRLTPNLTDFTFEGSVRIQVRIHKSTRSVTLNAVELKLEEQNDVSRLTYVDLDKTVSITKVKYDIDEETVVLQFAEELKPGEAFLQLGFTGTLNDKLHGFYRSKSIGPDGVERYSAVTQLQPADARRAFPCWDEPAHKATFDIILVVCNDGKTTALSNMPVVSDTVQAERRVVKFERTPIMSTYLVAFIVGEYDFIESQTEDGIRVRVYAPVGKAEQGRFSLDVSVRALDFYRQYFGIAYPLKKMDLIALSDFAFGAMENWGLVTYRETRLLVDPANSSASTKQIISLIVAHELAHQWFGNLVTLEWWTHLWLNEGFATFMQYLCVDHLFPHFNVWNQFVSDVLLRAMDLDALDNSHPIEVPIGPPSEVGEIFDAISYSKGASIIRMLYKYIGDETFRKGMNLYLTRHSYKNTQTEDLWDALEEASHKPIRHIMSSWTQQKGYPVITVTAQGEPLSQVVEMCQQKFAANGNLSESDSQMKWVVPVSMITTSCQDKPILETLLETTRTKVQVELKPDEWFKLNPNSVGTYRVNYSPDLLQRLFSGVSSQTIPPTDRLNLVNDLYALVLAGQKSSIELMRLMDTFRGERDYTVWCALCMIMSKFNQVLAGSECHQQFHAFSRTLINHQVFPWLGLTAKPDEKHEHTLLRALLLQRLVSFNDPAAIEQCREMFAKHVSGEELVAADLRIAVYSSSMKQNPEDGYQALLKLYRSTDGHEEKNRILWSIASVRDPKLIQQLMEFSIGNEVRSQDSVRVLGTLAANSSAREAVWQFFQSKIELFKSRYTSGFLVNLLVKVVSENFCSEEKAREVEQFFAANPYPSTERAVQQAIETIRLNAQLLQRDGDALKQFFASN